MKKLFLAFVMVVLLSSCTPQVIYDGRRVRECDFFWHDPALKMMRCLTYRTMEFRCIEVREVLADGRVVCQTYVKERVGQ